MDALWKEYLETRSIQLRDKLVENYIPIAWQAARKMHSRYPKSVSIDEFASAGMLGVLAAVETFTPEKGIPFEHYCKYKIRVAVLDWLRELDWIPHTRRQQGQKTRIIFGGETENSYVTDNGIDLSDWLEHRLKRLSDIEQQVIRGYYFQGLTFKQIGETISRSESGTSLIHHRAIEILRSEV